jgi:CRP-like cAMP-binding protein
MTERDRLELLRRVEPLTSQSHSSLRSLLPFMDEVRVQAGALIAEEGHLCHELLIVVEGRLEACRQGVATAVGPGEALGWDAMRDRGRHDATVRAITPAHLLVMSHAQFRAAEGISPRRANASSPRHLREFAAG